MAPAYDAIVEQKRGDSKSKPQQLAAKAVGHIVALARKRLPAAQGEDSKMLEGPMGKRLLKICPDAPGKCEESEVFSKDKDDL